MSERAKDSSATLTETPTLACSSQEKPTVRVSTLGPMVKSTTENGTRVSNMVRVCGEGSKMTVTLVNGTRAELTATGFIRGLMATNMKVSGTCA